jgi:hypothetical protein
MSSAAAMLVLRSLPIGNPASLLAPAPTTRTSGFETSSHLGVADYTLNRIQKKLRKSSA